MESSCPTINTQEIIGAGGYGIIYLNTDGTVTKAIHNKSACKEAGFELKKQQLAWNIFNTIKSHDVDNRIYNLA